MSTKFWSFSYRCLRRHLKYLSKGFPLWYINDTCNLGFNLCWFKILCCKVIYPTLCKKDKQITLFYPCFNDPSTCCWFNLTSFYPPTRFLNPPRFKPFIRLSVITADLLGYTLCFNRFYLLIDGFDAIYTGC